MCWLMLGSTPRCSPIRKGVGEVLRRGADGALIAYGVTVFLAWEAALLLAERGIEVTVVNARFASPVDRALLAELAKEQPFFVTLEDGSLAGGFGSAVLEAVQDVALHPMRVARLGVPDELCDHSDRKDTMARFGLTPGGVAETVERLLHEKTSRPTW